MHDPIIFRVAGTMVFLVLGAGLSVGQNTTTSAGMPAIHRAAAEGDQDAVRMQLLLGVPIDLPDERGLTPLHIACLAEQTEMVKTLMAAGAAVSARDKRGHTALHHVAMIGDLGIARVLIAQGADPNVRSDWQLFAVDSKAVGETPLHWACAYGHFDLIGVLIEAKADPMQATSTGITPVDVLRRAWTLPGSFTETDLRLATDPQLPIRVSRDAVDKTEALVACAALGDRRRVAMLSRSVPTVDCVDKRGRSPLCQAAAAGHFEVVEYLLRKGANPNYCDGSRHTALHFAASRHHFAVVKLLLDNGASPSVRDKHNKTPIDYVSADLRPPHRALHGDLRKIAVAQLEADIEKSLASAERYWQEGQRKQRQYRHQVQMISESIDLGFLYKAMLDMSRLRRRRLSAFGWGTFRAGGYNHLLFGAKKYADPVTEFDEAVPRPDYSSGGWHLDSPYSALDVFHGDRMTQDGLGGEVANDHATLAQLAVEQSQLCYTINPAELQFARDLGDKAISLGKLAYGDEDSRAAELQARVSRILQTQP